MIKYFNVVESIDLVGVHRTVVPCGNQVRLASRSSRYGSNLITLGPTASIQPRTAFPPASMRNGGTFLAGRGAIITTVRFLQLSFK